MPPKTVPRRGVPRRGRRALRGNGSYLATGVFLEEGGPPFAASRTDVPFQVALEGSDELESGREKAMYGMTRRTVVFLVVSAAVASLGGEEARAQEPFRSRCGAGVHVDERRGWIWLPEGEIFCPLSADPKAERSFVSYLRGDFATLADPTPGAQTNIGAVGISDGFALFRSAGTRPGDGFQLGISGSVFAQLDLDAPSFDLINADYLIGVPLTHRNRGFSGRLRVYHQSSHLGDEFLLAREPERINLSFEAVELLLSQEVGPLRVYGGGELFFRREPDDLPDHLAHGGIELRPGGFANGQLLLALDVKTVEEADWQTGWSARAGLEIARIPSPGHPPRIISLMGEFYDGPAPYGQFYREDIQSWGFGLHLSR